MLSKDTPVPLAPRIRAASWFEVLNDWRGADKKKRDVVIASFLLFNMEASKWRLQDNKEDPFGPIRHSFFKNAKRICSTGDDENILIFGAPSFAQKRTENFLFDGRVDPERG